MTDVRSFEAVTAVESLELPAEEHGSVRGRFRANADAEWTIGGRPNGGYLLAIMGRAATELTGHPHPLAASAHYLRPPVPGPMEVEVEVLREGRAASQLRARLVQDSRSCVEALFTNGRIDADASPYWSAGQPADEPTSWDDAFPVSSRGPSGLEVTIMDQVDLRLDVATTGFGRGQPTGRGELRGWLALPGGADFDPLSLLYAVDAFPPASLDVAVTGWVPTLELTAYVRALPAPGPVRIFHHARVIDDGRVDEECWVWDSRGRVVAHSTQLAGIRLV